MKLISESNNIYWSERFACAAWNQGGYEAQRLLGRHKGGSREEEGRKIGKKLEERKRRGGKVKKGEREEEKE